MINGAVDNLAMSRFELPLEGDDVAAAYYKIEGDRFILTHTEVPFRFSGQGVGSRLAESVLREIRRLGKKAVLKCPFFSAYLIKHPEFSDLVAG
jgi:predicted GNAT family acetyltransferase